MVVEILKVAASHGQAGSIESGGSERVDVRAREQAETAEQPPLALGQVRVGQVERGADRQVLCPH